MCLLELTVERWKDAPDIMFRHLGVSSQCSSSPVNRLWVWFGLTGLFLSPRHTTELWSRKSLTRLSFSLDSKLQVIRAPKLSNNLPGGCWKKFLNTFTYSVGCFFSLPSYSRLMFLIFISFCFIDIFRWFSFEAHKTLPGENRNGPVFDFVTKDLSEVFAEAQAEAVLICAVAKHWRAHGLWGDTHGDQEWMNTALALSPYNLLL